MKNPINTRFRNFLFPYFPDGTPGAKSVYFSWDMNAVRGDGRLRCFLRGSTMKKLKR
jgi:hypothetical protein